VSLLLTLLIAAAQALLAAHAAQHLSGGHGQQQGCELCPLGNGLSV
jgi:hypothetical protein